jgi:hypothetical protein
VNAPIATESVLREHLAPWLAKSRRGARAIVLRAQPTWSGPEVLQIDGRPVRIVEGISGLAALDAIRSAADNEFIAILTDLAETELGSAVMLDAYPQEVRDLDEWALVPNLFGVRDGLVNSGVRSLGSWVPRTLAALGRSRALPPAPGGALSAEHVTKSLLLALLDLTRFDELALSTVLAPLDDLAVRARLRELDDESRVGLIRAVAAHFESHLAMAIRVASIAGPVSVIAVGLVVAELWAGESVPPYADVAAARVRIERYIGATPSDQAARRFGAAARLIVERLLAADDHHVREIFEQSEQIFTDISWAEGAAASDLLPAGLRHRVSAFALAVEAAAADPTVEASLAVDAALSAVERHGARTMIERSLPTARMAARLVRWLDAAAPRPVEGLADALVAYSADGAWADRALGDLWDGDIDSALALAYNALAHAVHAVRLTQDTHAASMLTGGTLPESAVMPVEAMLSRLVVPLSASAPVLLIVLDGMSVPTAVELSGDIPSLGWTELVRNDDLHRGVALAALPTMTEYSRTSLLAGELLVGTQAVEKSRFGSAVGGVIFHKDDLRAQAGYTLPAPVLAAIADPKRKIVAAVLNTIDDALSGADIDAQRWTARSIAHLVALLEAAREAGRLVILTADHGHVIERGGELRFLPPASARWRTPDSGPAAPDEVTVSGPRVLAPGGTAVLAVDSGLRYAAKKPGYHGGASLAELAVPIMVLKPRGAADPAGWVEAPPQEPLWWNEPARDGVPAAVPAGPVKKARPKRASEAPTLFDPEPDVASAVTDLAGELIASAAYGARRGLAGRHPVEDHDTRTIIATLVASNGRAHRDTLATALGIPVHTFNGLLSTLRRMLNVEGYSVISVDADQVTVVLDIALLREQFELGGI